MISPNCPALSFPVETDFRCSLNGRSGFTAARHAREHLCEALYDLKHLELFSDLGVALLKICILRLDLGVALLEICILRLDLGVALLEICILRLEQSIFFAHLLEKGDMRGLPGVSKQPFVVPYPQKDLKRS
jgi:hypothetical protein